MQRHAKDRAPLIVKALGTTGVRRVLDLGGGSGAYSIAFAKACPSVQCEIVDLAEVVPLTVEYVRQAGVSGQVSVRAGDMLVDDFGSGYDLIMLNAICHMFSEQQNREIFRRARKALSPNGRLVVQDFIRRRTRQSKQAAFLKIGWPWARDSSWRWVPSVTYLGQSFPCAKVAHVFALLQAG